MIRVLIVDDEKIVRQGLKSFMPWESFGMTVIGEANNGEKALQFLEANKVDLLLTDISMPVMSGMELMREVRQKYPAIQIVVLTLHQDFELIQEALRLGAIDYIAKTQLEMEQFEDVLGRIASLLEQKRSVEVKPLESDQLNKIEEVFAVYSLYSQEGELNLQSDLLNEAKEVDIGIWYWEDLAMNEQMLLKEWINKEDVKSHFSLIHFMNLGDFDQKSILQLLRVYRKNHLFYDYHPAHPICTVSANEIENVSKAEAGDDILQLKEMWLSSGWINNDAVYADMVQKLKGLRLPPIRLTRVFFSITDEWNRLYGQILPSPIVLEDFLSSWYQFEKWLEDTRELMRIANKKENYSTEIHESIMKAMSIVQQMLHQPMTAGDIAKMVNMSNSYFSQCFKDIVGQTYTEYLRDIRMERAKEYLRNTSKTIQWIAEQVGFTDEKYFSRLFREQVGLLPSQYRQME
jgi:two-component system, response regulator YesN